MTRKGVFFLSVLLFIFSLPGALNAQCKQFAKNTCKPGLSPYQHDGNYDAAALLVEGEVAEMYKTFHSDIDYRIGVCSSNNLSPIHFKVMHPMTREVYYDNSEHDFDWKWDLKLESSQQLMIEVTVPVSDENADVPEEGCVTVMIGAMDF